MCAFAAEAHDVGPTDLPSSIGIQAVQFPGAAIEPPTDLYPLILRSAADAFLADGLEAGRIALAPIAAEIWPGLPRGSMPGSKTGRVTERATGRRSFSAARSAATFRRDHFCCRYCGAEIIPKPIVLLMHSLYPVELPFHRHYKAGCVHPIFWTRVAEADHLVPGAVGGSWTNPDNHVTACVRCNTRKGPGLIADIGWTLKEPIHGWDGLVSLYRPVWERADRPEPSSHLPWLRVFCADR